MSLISRLYKGLKSLKRKLRANYFYPCLRGLWRDQHGLGGHVLGPLLALAESHPHKLCNSDLVSEYGLTLEEVVFGRDAALLAECPQYFYRTYSVDLASWGT